MITLPTLDYTNILNRENPLAEGLLAQWIVLPGQYGGTFWYDTVSGRVGTLTSMAIPGTSTSGWGTPKRPGGLGEMRFDGSNDRVAFSDTGFPIGSADRTVELWMRCTGTQGAAFTYGKDQNGQSFYILFDTSTPNKVFIGTYGAGSNLVGTSNINDGVWHQVVGTTKSSTLYLYVDGKLENSGTIAMGISTVLNAGFIGGFPAIGYWLNGAVDDVRIYNRAWGPVEVANDYQESARRYSTLLNWEETELDQPSIFYSIPPPVAGIQPDAASNSGIQTAQSTYTFNRTCTGTDRYLDISVALLSAGQTVSSVVDDYGGGAVNAVFVGAQTTVTSFGRVEMWRVVAPATGTKSIQVNLSGSSTSVAMATSYTGVHQTSPTEAFNSAQATNVGAADATVTVTSVADNCWVIAALATDDGSVTPNQTSRSNVSGGATLSGVVEDTGPKTPAGGQAMSVTGIGALATWAIAGYAIRPIAASNLGVVGPFVDGRLVKRGILQGRLIL